MRARSLPSPTPWRLRRYARAVRPVITDRPAGSFSPDSGRRSPSSRRRGPRRPRRPSRPCRSKLNRAAYGIGSPVRLLDAVATAQPRPPRARCGVQRLLLHRREHLLRRRILALRVIDHEVARDAQHDAAAVVRRDVDDDVHVVLRRLARGAPSRAAPARCPRRPASR